jgi:hypothetical protein
MQLTFVIPVGPSHTEIARRAIASVEAQTVPCASVVIHDMEGRGAGWARNRGLEQVTTPFVSFLDADDWLEPTFAEKTLAAFDGRCYVYTDWFRDGAPIKAPDCPWYNGTWHVITALLPTEWVRTLGGFDETLSGGEDTYLFARLVYANYCGKRLLEPLVHYSTDGQRARAFVGSAAHTALNERLTREFGGKRMSCCGGNIDMEVPPAGERQEGDVLAVALWGGNRQERGRITGRLYPRTGNNKRAWVNPRDAEAAPHLWKVVEQEQLPTGWSPDFAEGVVQMFGQEALPGRAVPAILPVEPSTAVKPDVARVVERAQRGLGNA